MDWGTPCGTQGWSPNIWMSEVDPLCMMAPLTCPALPGDPSRDLAHVPPGGGRAQSQDPDPEKQFPGLHLKGRGVLFTQVPK